MQQCQPVLKKTAAFTAFTLNLAAIIYFVVACWCSYSDSDGSSVHSSLGFRLELFQIDE